MFSAFSTGLFLGLSLIIAIGAQNAFVLRQGILRKHTFYIALFCSIADALLIILGVIGISLFLNDFINQYSKIIYGIASIWLTVYGLLRLHAALRNRSIIINNNEESASLINAILIVSIFTFANPHVYLDTMVLIGSISQQYANLNRVFFTFGACSASFIWFFGIAYGAKLISPIMQKPKHWRIFDFLIAIIMFIIAFNLASNAYLI